MATFRIVTTVTTDDPMPYDAIAGSLRAVADRVEGTQESATFSVEIIDGERVYGDGAPNVHVTFSAGRELVGSDD